MLDLLLRDGWSIADPNDDVLDDAQRLQSVGLVQIHWHDFVVCADARDEDFPPPVRNCQARIYLNADMDKDSGEFHCPECDRVVYPNLDGKHRHVELRCHVLPAGIIAFIREELESLGVCRELADGVFRCDHVDGEVIVCLVEICREPKYLSRDFAAMNPMVFIAIDSRNRDQRFLDEPWLIRTSLAALWIGTDDLLTLATTALSRGSPATLSNASLPVYNKVVPPLSHTNAQEVVKERRFVVEFGTDFIRVNGRTVVTAKASAQLRVFSILWKRFLEDLLAGRPSEDFRPMSLDKIADAFQGSDSRDAVDAITVRRHLNRLQNDLTQTIRQELGMPVERDDIIENLRGEGQTRKNTGYRINPLRVFPRASCPT
ncbi:MAG: hypothetical protein HQL64_15700 [Magnetococcales bacterium]|nr:hypothetical protein [Magnetococcales bacterium]